MEAKNVEVPEKSAPPAEKSALAFRLNPLVLFPGFVAALMLLADYTQSSPVFCTEVGSGCAAVRRSAFAHFGPIPTPVLGLLGLALLLALGLWRGPLAAKVHALVGGGAVLGGLMFFAVQVWGGQFCQFCLVADASALLAGGLGLLRLGGGWQPPARLGARIAQGVGFAVLGSLAAFLVLTKQAPIPTVVAQELAKTPPGKVLILDFIDFECPYCRDVHASLTPILEEQREHVRIVRKHVPLSMHLHAEPAARASLCGERMGQAEPMLERIFALEPAAMELASFTAIATSLGLDPAAFGQCMQDPSLKSRLEADRAAWKSLGAEGLPTVYVGTRRFVGLVPPEQVRAEIEAGTK